MIETLISSKTRIKLLLRFFLNSNSTAYLRGLESEMGESSNSIRLELNRFEKAGMLTPFVQGNKKFFAANTKHPLYGDVHNIILKYVGLDQIIEKVIERLGEVNKVYLTGPMAKGIDNDVIDLIFVGNINKIYLIELIDRAEKLIKRKVRYLSYTIEEFDPEVVNQTDYLLLWENENNHYGITPGAD